MATISMTLFRQNPLDYLRQVLEGKELLISTKSLGSFRVVPVEGKDREISKEELNTMIDKAVADYKAGKTIRVTPQQLKKMAGL